MILNLTLKAILFDMSEIITARNKLKKRIRAWFAPSDLKMPIRIKITVPYFLLSVLIAVSAAFLVTNIVFDTVEERFRNQLVEVGQLSSELMVFEEDKLLETLRLLTNSKSVLGAFAERDPEKLRVQALGVAINQQVDAVEFLDEAGNLVLAMRHIVGSGVEDYSFSTGGDNSQYQNLDFVNMVLENQDDLIGDKFSGYVDADWGKYFYVSGPAYDPTVQLKGVVLVGTSLDSLVQSIHTSVLGQVTLYDMNGRVIASSFPYAPDSLGKELTMSVLELQDDERSKLRDFEEQRDVTVSSLSYSEVFLPWEVRGDVDLGILGVALPRNFIVTQSPYTRLQVTLMTAIAFFLVIMIGLYLANLITRPLTKLVEASASVANGDLSVQVDLNTNDEIASLAASFNQMVTNLSNSRRELLDTYDDTLTGWALALEMRDKETEGHTKRVTALTVAIAERFEFTDEELVNIRRGAILHDIGKMGIPDHILHKPGSLNDEEWEIMKQHSTYSYELMRHIRFLQPAVDIPHYHHEHWNGGGYPDGLKGEEIPLPARIFAVVDCWDALTNDRPYRKKSSKKEALQIIQNSAGKIYDPKVVQIFCEYIKQFAVEIP